MPDITPYLEERHENIGGITGTSLSPTPSVAPTPSPEAIPAQHDEAPSNPSYVSYSYYQFLAITNVSAVRPQDFQFLERQGCLHVPSRPALDTFVRQYFLYLQPILPILDEGAFWDMYAQRRPSPRASDGKISLLLFQAMLFVCCNLVPRTVLRRIGFATKRAARAAIYRRAKLLFDLETEMSSIDKSRAALLMASWSFSSYEVPRTPSTPWLAIAIQHAKDAEAHRYMAFDRDSEEHAVRKRLWWGCIIRDRLFSLGMRRALHIRPVDFDLSRNSALGPSDLKDEMNRSMVHNATTKERLGEVLGLLAELCIVLTDILDLAFPIEDSLDHRHRRTAAMNRSEKARRDLHRWYRDAARRFRKICPPFRTQGAVGVHDSVFLNVSLLHMYYYAARIALGHFEILHMSTSEMPFPAGVSDTICFSTSQADLQDAVIATTTCLEGLMRSRLVKRLPITAISCTALPLLLHALDAETSPAPARPMDSTHSVVVRRRLAVLRQAMETYQFQYEGVEWIRSAINQVASLARWGPVFDWESVEGQQRRNVSPRQWDEPWMPPFRPGGYLRLAFTLDIVFSKGRLPENDAARGRFSGLPQLSMATPMDWHERRVAGGVVIEVPGGDDDGEVVQGGGRSWDGASAPPYSGSTAQDEQATSNASSTTSRDDTFDWAALIATPTTIDVMEGLGFGEDPGVIGQDDAMIGCMGWEEEPAAVGPALDWLSLFGSWEDLGCSDVYICPAMPS